ncbi:MAG: hypothetical protein KGL39_33420 [Patescibacteria group bacterium]|nr:hypothetical protein [Patescibacteria group bacterium]
MLTTPNPLQGMPAPSSSGLVGPSTSGTTPQLTAYAGGMVKMVGLKQMLEEERAQAVESQAEPVIQGLAGRVRHSWQDARIAKQITVEERMLQSIRQRRGEYDPPVLAKIREQGGSEIFMMLTSTKCRAAASWLRDTLLGTGSDKPWSLQPSPVPSLSGQSLQAVDTMVAQQTQQYTTANGLPPTPEMIALARQLVHDRIIAETENSAKRMAANMEEKMEDQLDEGGWYDAFSAFLDDIVTFPSAFLKGPVVRKKPRMKWEGNVPQIETTMVLEWERVDPYNIYPSPQASSIDDGYLIERHRLTRQDLNELIGVDGYNDAAIRAVIDEYGRGGLREWLTNDVGKAVAEGKSGAQVLANPDHLIDALQFWGHVSGEDLVDWGMDEEQVPDQTKDYQCEVWVIGRWVIKAVLNPDPLGRRPYYKASYEEVPGAFWGNSVADLVRDTQTMCNAAARALANNMGISSGPQVWVNTDRMPPGEDITEMFPWKIWQGTSDPLGGNDTPITFFQPQSFVQELWMVYQQFSLLADEYSGVPRYMTGTEGAGGAGRTASGLSMMISNAGKTIKQVIGNIDIGVIRPLIDRLYYYNMRYSDDPDLKGDVNIIPMGANQLVAKEQAQVRRNEFLQMILQSPEINQIVGIPGVAALLRTVAKTLDMDTDEIVPSDTMMKIKEGQQQLEQQHALQMQQVMQQQGQPGTQPSPQAPMTQGQPGTQPSPQAPMMNVGSGQNLMNGAPVVDQFQPQPR